MFQGSIDQIAFIAHTDEDVADIKKYLQLENDDWTVDHVVASGVVRGEQGTNEARLEFNYKNGIEVEILRYLDGPNYAEDIRGGALCHIGIHADKIAEAYQIPPTFVAPIIQQVETQSHTNEFLLKSGRRYRYTIYDTLEARGFYTKVIERIYGENE